MKKMHDNSRLVNWKLVGGCSAQNVFSYEIIIRQLKSGHSGHLSGIRQAALYFEQLNFACLANHNTRQREDQMVGL